MIQNIAINIWKQRYIKVMDFHTFYILFYFTLAPWVAFLPQLPGETFVTEIA